MEEIFSIQVNAKGMQFLRKTKKLVAYLFWVSVMISVLALLLIWPTLQLLVRGELPPFTDQFRAYCGLIYALIFALVFPFQTYYYYMFVRRTSRSYEVGDVESFNNAFRLLYLNAAMMMITYTLNLLFFLLDVF